jgi:hypothetical protein
MDDFDDVIRLLRENRPEATELELDQIKQRARRRAAQPARRTQDMKSRLAILITLVAGMMFSATGAGLAVQGLTSNDASVAQYGPGDQQSPGAVGGEESTGGGSPSSSENAADEVQATRQVEVGANGGDELPFTGFLAIPVLLGGVALLSAGLVLRRRAGHEDDH